ncbi:unnamed protein product [Parajaminaea phylloscopi]
MDSMIAASASETTQHAEDTSQGQGAGASARNEPSPSTRCDDKAQSSGASRQRISVGICALPDAILAAIFCWLFHGGLGPEDFPPAILMVCHFWRQLALATKDLWRDTSIFKLCNEFHRSNPEWDVQRSFSHPRWKARQQRQAIEQRTLDLLEGCTRLTQRSMYVIEIRTEMTFMLIECLRYLPSTSSTLRCLTLTMDWTRHLPFISKWATAKLTLESRTQVYDLIRACPNLSELTLSMPAPTEGISGGLHENTSQWTHRRGLQTLTLLDSSFSVPQTTFFNTVQVLTELESHQTGQHERAFADFWGGLASQLTKCNLATLCDPTVARAVLEKAQETVQVLLVSCSDFMASIEGRLPLKFPHLKRLCLLGAPTEELNPTSIAPLPQLEEIEGTVDIILWFWSRRIKSVTIWLPCQYALPSSAETPKFPKAFGSSSGLIHLTIIGPAKQALRFLEDMSLNKACVSQADHNLELPHPCLHTLTLIAGREAAFVGQYFGGGLGSCTVLTADYRSHLDLANSVRQIVESRRALPETINEFVGQSMVVNQKIQRVTLRDYWCTHRELWDLRATKSTKMMQRTIPTTSLPEGGLRRSPSGADEQEFDIVPRVPSEFDQAEWKGIVADAIRYGLHI